MSLGIARIVDDLIGPGPSCKKKKKKKEWGRTRCTPCDGGTRPGVYRFLTRGNSIYRRFDALHGPRVENCYRVPRLSYRLPPTCQPLHIALTATVPFTRLPFHSFPGNERFRVSTSDCYQHSYARAHLIMINERADSENLERGRWCSSFERWTLDRNGIGRGDQINICRDTLPSRWP